MARGSAGAPVVLADTQDNPGAGGNGDTVGLLSAMLRARAPNSVLGLLIDPASATRATEVGAGASADFSLGSISGVAGHAPLSARFKVARLGDGKFTCTGPMFKGFRMNLGPMALLEHDGVKVVLASRKCQAADQEMFRHLGVEPIRQSVVALKSSVHFRADFEPIATRSSGGTFPRTGAGRPVRFRLDPFAPGHSHAPSGAGLYSRNPGTTNTMMHSMTYELLIDCGNTFLKWGRYQPRRLSRKAWPASNASNSTGYCSTKFDRLPVFGVVTNHLSKIVISSVAGTRVRNPILRALEAWPRRRHHISSVRRPSNAACATAI